jgi:hypothetical protein
MRERMEAQFAGDGFAPAIAEHVVGDPLPSWTGKYRQRWSRPDGPHPTKRGGDGIIGKEGRAEPRRVVTLIGIGSEAQPTTTRHRPAAAMQVQRTRDRCDVPAAPTQRAGRAGVNPSPLPACPSSNVWSTVAPKSAGAVEFDQRVMQPRFLRLSWRVAATDLIGHLTIS